MAPALERPQFAEILRTLVAHGVEFVLVGGGAAVLAGAWQATDDLDVVPRMSPENHLRLLEALQEMDATYLDLAGRTIRPDLGKLSSFRLHLLRTRLGRLDVIRAIREDLDYERLVGRSIEYEVGEIVVRAIDLETLIEAKELANRDKDRGHLPVLREALRLQRLKDSTP